LNGGGRRKGLVFFGGFEAKRGGTGEREKKIKPYLAFILRFDE